MVQSHVLARVVLVIAVISLVLGLAARRAAKRSGQPGLVGSQAYLIPIALMISGGPIALKVDDEVIRVVASLAGFVLSVIAIASLVQRRAASS